MSNIIKDCNCTISGQSANCKECRDIPEQPKMMSINSILGQDGKLCQVEREKKMEPRLFQGARVDEGYVQYDSPDDEDFDRLTNQLSTMMRRPTHNRGGRMVDDSLLLERNRTSLRKFESLEINGSSLTGMSIGGFDIDIGKAAQKAREVVPIPAAKLPLIFMDETLNFYFHFFDGMTKILGADPLDMITSCDHHFDDGDREVIDKIEDMIRSQFDRHDSEQITFIKKIMIATFETSDDRRRRDDDPTLIVAANLYGLQYIETGMKMKNNDLKDWLNRCHCHYKTLWFNTFKATSVPSFAYGARRATRSSSYSSSSSSRMPDLIEGRDEDASTVRSHRRSRRSSGNSSTYGRTPSINAAKARKITKWMAAS